MIQNKTTTAKHTHRGTCQVCGAVQAAMPKNGQRLAKHGYTVNYGFFNGVCRGADAKPLEFEKSITEATIKWLIDEVAPAADKRASDLESGKIEPKFYNEKYDRGTGQTVRIYCKREEVVARYQPTAEATIQQQITAAIYNAKGDAKGARLHAAMLKRMIESRHGRPLYPIAERKEIKAGTRLCMWKKNAIVEEVKDARVTGCGPHLNGQMLPHAVIRFEGENGRVMTYPTRLIRQASILS